MDRNALLIFYHKKNKFSFNALLGSIEKDEEILRGYEFYFIRNFDRIFDRIEEIINIHKKIILAFSLTTPQFFYFEPYIRSIKNKYKNRVILIAGGPHPTGLPHSCVDIGFDYVFRFESEETFKKFLKKILKEEEIENVKGIFFKKNGECYFSGRPDPIDLNDYPPFSVKFKRFGPIEITRGCTHVCFYCQTPRIFGIKPRHRNIENILRYVEILKKHKKTDVRFITPDALSYGSKDGKSVNLEALNTLLKEIRNILKEEGRIFFGSFPSEVRPEHVNEEIAFLLKKYVDNELIVIGAQTGSERLLKKIKRDHTVEDVINAVKILKKAGFDVAVDFIFGIPGETEEDLKETFEVLISLIKMGAKIHAHSFLPLPQTPLFYKKPYKIPMNLRKFIGKNVRDGIVFGAWSRQEKLAQEIYERFFKE